MGTGVVAKRGRRHLVVDEGQGREDSSDKEDDEEGEEEDDGMAEIIKEDNSYVEENDPDYDYDYERGGAKHFKSITEMSFAELEKDEFDLLLQEAREPLPEDILTMEELA